MAYSRSLTAVVLCDGREEMPGWPALLRGGCDLLSCRFRRADVQGGIAADFSREEGCVLLLSGKHLPYERVMLSCNPYDCDRNEPGFLPMC